MTTTTEEFPIGCVVFPTAIAYIEGMGILHNRDNLAGPENPNEEPWIWGARITIAGSNGYRHEKDWLQFKKSHGKACFTLPANTEGNPVGQNRMVTFVRVESEEIAMQKGPDAYGPSR